MTKRWRRKCGKGTKNVETMNSSSFPLNFATEQITTFDSNEKVSHLEWGNSYTKKKPFFFPFFLFVFSPLFCFRFLKNENPSSLSFIKQDFFSRNKWFLILLILVCKQEESEDNGKSVGIGFESLSFHFLPTSY